MSAIKRVRFARERLGEAWSALKEANTPISDELAADCKALLDKVQDYPDLNRAYNPENHA